MSKTLTGKWKNGELLAGLYYFRKNDGLIYIEFHDDYRGFCTPAEYIKEVLALVPSYDEYCLLTKKAERADYLDEKLKYYTPEECLIIKQLEKRLEIATKALKRIDPPNIIFDDYRNSGIDLWEIAHNALKEMEGVK